MYLSEMFIEDVLNEQSKLKALLAAGKLGKESIKRAGKAGLFKSRKEYFKSFDKGTQNILDKYKTMVSHKDSEGKIITDPLNSFARSSFKHVSPMLHVTHPEAISKKNAELNLIVRRHEADEIRTRARYKKKIQSQRGLGKKTSPFDTEYGNVSNSSLGQHASDNVLKNEREYTNTANALYGKKGGRRRLEVFRKHSREYKNIENVPKSVIRKYDDKYVKDATKYENGRFREHLKNKREKESVNHKWINHFRKEMKNDVKKLKSKNTDPDKIKNYMKNDMSSTVIRDHRKELRGE